MTQAKWRKSSLSNQVNACVEVLLTRQTSGVRDSKNASGAVLAFPVASFAAFRDSVKVSRTTP
ncbi:DUF397 domain-containing protein [Actinosynnema sp. NPDC047251]|uniref:DUF397 domain-containing protein n=1 Tax=Saccharothrix espanaensis (strain ATCC 51144 / DSM 44229 / JCM 9112 / NBRC 15066 / NRRL 15764) TaxID=1179773 RepID=K0JY70_SACES|nr:DUF397 domain-containing protein [Saccharothrix espanaensis]CCH29128.1 hypothetical protein BN6_18070 [Saccharothrix espanaensis DSM 44229]